MDIKRLLEYAAIDAEMVKLNQQFNDEPVVKEYTLQTKRYKEASGLIVKLNEDAEDIIKQIGAMTDRYQECMAQLAEYQSTAGEIEDENEADFYSKNVEKLLANLSVLSSDVAALGKTIADIRKQTSKAFAEASDATARVKSVRDSYNEVKARYAPMVAEIKARLQKAATGLEQELTIYLDLKKAHKKPLVTFNGYNCGGCFMDIDANTRNRIETDGYVLCPTCGCILYKEQ